MKTYQIPHTDLVVSRIAYGCGALASVDSPKAPSADASPEVIAQFKANHSKEAIDKWKREPPSAGVIAKAGRVINAAYDSGITLFDHADIYGWGKCEQVFGEVLRQSASLRDNIVIQSKCGIRFAEDMTDPRPGDPHRLDLSRDQIVSSVEGSLRRLRTDRLDILLLHRPDALMEPEEVARAFDELHSSGKVRYFGVSNHTAAQIELLKKYLRQSLVVNQVHVSLAYSYLIADGIEANREGEFRITSGGYTGVAGTLDYCRLHDIQVQAWAPLRGADALKPPGLLNPPADAPPEVRRAAQVLATVAKNKNTTPSAIALAWLLRHPAGIVPIIGPTSADHVIENCAADRVTLSREEWYDLFISAAGVPPLQLLELVIPKHWL